MNRFWLLIFPAVLCFYIGLLLTIVIWYPDGLTPQGWQDHLVNFSIIYISWLIVLFIYTLFDLVTFRSSLLVISRLLGAMLTCGIIAVAYFYFQPQLILTPRRFLLVHLLITALGLALWYSVIQNLLPKIWKKQLYLHPQIYEQDLHGNIVEYLEMHRTLGWKFAGTYDAASPVKHLNRATVILPVNFSMQENELRDMFEHKRQGVEFLEYHKFIELTQRMVPLEKVSEIWFLRSVNYSPRALSDALKRTVDIIIGAIGSLVLVLLLPILFAVIKLDSVGPVLFIQRRIGQGGRPFNVYKLRTMTTGSATDTWTQEQDLRITRLGKILRKLRLDELPQFWNIFIGNMSLVGPRPEQAAIVASLIDQIPYYNERHIVKPGLTGWSQLHVYANSLEGTKLKLQYDFYYIKHRSLWFDLEIVLRTIFHIISMQGR